MPRAIGMVVSTRMATLRELDDVYSAEDLYTLLEIAVIDSHNRRVASDQDE